MSCLHNIRLSHNI